jgi:hypothetical protein
VLALPLTAAAGVLAHGVHLGLILLGVGGVIGLLAPGWRASRAERRRPPSTLTHEERMDAIRGGSR